LLLAHIAAKDLLDEKSTAAVIEAPRKEMAAIRKRTAVPMVR
jgi:hypothetical protein